MERRTWALLGFLGVFACADIDDVEMEEGIAHETYAAAGCGTSTITVNPSADVYVSEGSPSSNYGTATSLRAGSGSGVETRPYLTFKLTTLSNRVCHAKLRVYVTDATTNAPAVYAAGNTRWGETTTTWANQAGIAGPVGANLGGTQTGWIEYDVTELIHGNGTYSLALKADSTDLLVFYSREGTYKPELVVETRDPSVQKDFQQGVSPTSSYAGAATGWIRRSFPNTNYATSTVGVVDGSTTAGESILLKWDVASHFSVDDTVTSAEVTINVPSLTSTETFEVYRVLKAWNASQVTWNRASQATAWERAGAKGDTDRFFLPIGSLVPRATGSHTLVLNEYGEAMMQDWIEDSGTNHGVIIAREGSGRFDVSVNGSAPSSTLPRLRSAIITCIWIPPAYGTEANFPAAVTPPGEFNDYADPKYGTKIIQLTDAGNSMHGYSYWPAINANGTKVIVNENGTPKLLSIATDDTVTFFRNMPSQCDWQDAQWHYFNANVLFCRHPTDRKILEWDLALLDDGDATNDDPVTIVDFTTRLTHDEEAGIRHLTVDSNGDRFSFYSVAEGGAKHRGFVWDRSSNYLWMRDFTRTADERLDELAVDRGGATALAIVIGPEGGEPYHEVLYTNPPSPPSAAPRARISAFHVGGADMRQIVIAGVLGMSFIACVSSEDPDDDVAVERTSLTTTSFTATADSHVDSIATTTNYGSATTLSVRAASTGVSEMRTLITFDIRSLGNNTRIRSAKMRLHVSDGTSSGPWLHPVQHAWTESTVTWSNQPARQPGLPERLTAIPSGDTLEWDVGGWVSEPGVYTFALVASGTDMLSIASREDQSSARRPTLIVDTYASGEHARRITVSEDAYVDSANPSTNFGTARALYAMTGTPTQEIYLKYSVSGLTSTPSKVLLRLKVTEDTVDAPVLYQAASSSWTESGLTWNNKPQTSGSAISNVKLAASDGFAEYDVTSIVTANGTYSFKLVPESSDRAAFHSREGVSLGGPDMILIATLLPIGTCPEADATDQHCCVDQAAAPCDTKFLHDPDDGDTLPTWSSALNCKQGEWWPTIPDRDFAVVQLARPMPDAATDIIVLALHGGATEQKSDNIALDIAAEHGLDYWIQWAGLSDRCRTGTLGHVYENKDAVHVESNEYNHPGLEDRMEAYETAISIHGHGLNSLICVGGESGRMRSAFLESFLHDDFTAVDATSDTRCATLRGLGSTNPVNMGRSHDGMTQHGGLQLELPFAARARIMVPDGPTDTLRTEFLDAIDAVVTEVMTNGPEEL